MYLIIVSCLLLISPTYGESASELVEALRQEMKQMILHREQEKEEMKELLRTEMQKMRLEREKEKEEMTRKVERLVETLPPIPCVVSCAYQKKWTKADSVITYDRHTVELYNGYRPGGAEGGIDLDTGRFNVGKGGSGYYTVTYSGHAVLDDGEWVGVHLYRNGRDVGEHDNWYSSIAGWDLGSRTVILHLDEQDYLELRTGVNFSGDLYDLTFCASLAPLPYGHPSNYD